jgi:Domain of unknown function (DUF1876)
VTSYNIPVDVIVTDEATVAEASFVEYERARDRQTVTGYAKKHPRDEVNAEIGFNLAVARALSALADEYAKRAAEAVGGTVEVGGYEYEVVSEAPANVSLWPFSTPYADNEDEWRRAFYDAISTTTNIGDSLKYVTNNYGF